MEIPKQYRGTEIVSVFQQRAPNTKYYAAMNGTTGAYLEDRKGRERIGDRFVRSFYNINFDFVLIAEAFAGNLDPKKKLGPDDIGLEEILDIKA